MAAFENAPADQASLTMAMVPPNVEVGFVPDAATRGPVIEAGLSLRQRITRGAARTALAASTLTGSAVGAEALTAAPAHAGTVWSQHVYNTGSYLWLHPDSSTIHSAVSDQMPDGTTFDVTCWKYGDAVEGDSIWDFGTDTATGHTGYVADKYIDTPVTEGNEASQLLSLGLPECGTSTNNSSSSEQTISEYNGQLAANWAISHAEDRQIYGADECTWFVSNAMWVGGLPKSSEWTDEGSHGHLHPLPGTKDAWVPEALKDYLMSAYPQSTFTQLNFHEDSVPQAKPGDIVFYDWGDGHLDHATLVVDDAPGTQYPEVSEWGNVAHAGESFPSIKQGWTWSRVYNGWIQKVYRGAKAYLLHIDPGLDGLQTTGDPNTYNNIG